jgi:hypothetical protein
VIVSDIIDSDHLPVVFHILLDYVKIKNLSETVEKITDWEQFESLDSDSMPPRVGSNSEKEADKAALSFTVSTALAYRLSTIRFTLSDINNHDLPGLDSLLKYKQRLQKLWQKPRNPASKTAVKIG